MNAISKPEQRALELYSGAKAINSGLILETVKEIRSIIEPVAPVASTRLSRFVALLEEWTQASYEAWEERAQLPYHPWD